MTRECTYPQGRHGHGTHAANVKDRYRRTDCTAANTAASRTATRERIYGDWHPNAFDELIPKTLATTTADRLLHHAHVCATDGQSSRLAHATAGKG